MKLDHLGLVVENIQKYFNEFLMPVLGVKELSGIYIDHNQLSKVAFVKTANNTHSCAPDGNPVCADVVTPL